MRTLHEVEFARGRFLDFGLVLQIAILRSIMFYA